MTKRSMKELRRQGARGQATIEFLLTSLLIFFLFVGSIELVILVHTYNVLADAAKEGVRYAIVHGSSVDSAYRSGPTCGCLDIIGPAAPTGTIPGYGSGKGVVRTYAQLSLHDVSSSKMTVTADYNPNGDNGKACNDPGCLVRVTVAYPYAWLFGLGWQTITVNAAAEARIVN
jgi:Flp pilus assembly protein TadG